MKFSLAVVVAVALTTPNVAAFVAPHAAAPCRPAVSLQAHNNNNKPQQSMMASAVAAVVGWSLASQAAFAGILPPASNGTYLSGRCFHTQTHTYLVPTPPSR
jgi:hypothetical protein